MTNDQAPMTNQIPMVKIPNKNYNLEERTAKFGEEIIKFVKGITNTPENIPLKKQLVRAGTSIGANYCEADEAESKKDFVHKIGLCKKESRETKYWLRMISVVNQNLKEKARKLWKEAHEFNLIFASIIHTSRKRK